jgi:hypothetical protein
MCGTGIYRLMVMALFLGVSLRAGASADDRKEAYGVLISAEVQDVKMVQLPEADLLQPGITGGPATRLRVAAVATSYKCSTLQVRGTEATPGWSGYLHCYELRAAEAGTPYSWSLWSYDMLAHFRLFAGGAGRNYLCWVRGRDVCFAEVSKPKDKVVALTDLLSDSPPEQFVTVPVSILVPEVRRWGLNAIRADITVTSLTRDDKGTFELKISDPEGTKSYTIAGQGQDWRLAEPEAKGEPEATKPEAVTPQAAAPQPNG